MLLFSPMWCHEVERIGFSRCSRAADLLRAASDYCTLAAFAALIASFAAGFSAWYAAALWLTGRLFCILSLYIIARRRFRYDDDKIIASWRDGKGRICRYTFRENLRDSGYSPQTWFEHIKTKPHPPRRRRRHPHRRPSPPARG
jgi:hypothetical protein